MDEEPKHSRHEPGDEERKNRRGVIFILIALALIGIGLAFGYFKLKL